MPDPDLTTRLHQDAARFAREAGGLDASGFVRRTLDAIGAAGEPKYTRAELRANLVTKQQIAEQVQVDLANVSNWAARYDDWPEAFLSGTGYGSHDGGNGALYWWPDVAAFLDRHGLPKPSPTRKPGGSDGQ